MIKVCQKISAVLDENKARNIVVLDNRSFQTVGDFVIIATAHNDRHCRLLIDCVGKEILVHRSEWLLSCLARDGYEGGQWIVSDFSEILLHVFLPHVRLFYQIDDFYKDCPLLITLEGGD